jgi:O-antigen/teichoic acid export membrane protein
VGLAQKAGKAGSLMLIRKGWGALLNLFVMAYLARTLDKGDFGLVAISGTLIGFIQVMGLSGIGDYVIFNNGENKREILNSAFWLNLWITLAVVILVLLALPWWVSLYDDERISDLVIILSVSFFFNSISSIPATVFRKELNYGPMVAIQTVFGTASQGLSVLFAFLGFGVYSLALPAIIVAPLMCGAFFWKSGFIPDFRNHGQKLWKEIFSYTKHIIGSRLLNKVANEGDTLLIGKLLGMEALGIYDIAFKLANIFNSHLLPIITNISFPVFSILKEDLGSLRIQYLRMIDLISFVFFPLVTMMILFAPILIDTLYGENWQSATMPFQILCCFAFLRSISSPTSGMYNALGRQQTGFLFTLFFTPVLVLVIFLSSSNGLLITCISITVTRVIGSIVNLIIVNQILKVSFKDFFEPLGSTVVSVSIVVLIFSYFSLISSFAYVLLYAFLFVSIMYLVFKNQFELKFNLVKRILPRF